MTGLQQTADTLDLGFANFTATGLELPDEIRFNDWKRLGERLLRITDASNWAIGDWLNYGERYRRDYTAAMEIIDREYGALRGYAYVASKVENATRVAHLSWSHHRLVAPLDPEQQRYWLDESLRQGWTVRELEQAIGETSSRTPRPAAIIIRLVGEDRDVIAQAADQDGEEPNEWLRRIGLRHARERLGLEIEAA